jgi:hypothetical protein
MKKQFFKQHVVNVFITALLICNQWVLSAQKIMPNHEMEHQCELDFSNEHFQLLPPPDASFEAVASVASAPNISVSFSQEENGNLLYEPVAGWTGGAAKKAQLSLRIWVKNLGPNVINWNQVTIEYVQNGTVVSKSFGTGIIPIVPNGKKDWQNSRDYNEEGNVIFIDSPLPTSVWIKLYFIGYSTPVFISKPLAPYTKTYGMPFRAFDLAENEVWESGSTHAGGLQVFAYDMGVFGYTSDGISGGWSNLLPGKDGTQNSHYRVWGKPVYAMADGTVVEFLNDCPNNPKPGVKDTASYNQYDYGKGGNHFYIQHGDNIALYAHLQKGSLNPKLMTVGAMVKAGDFLGLAGNSGSSSGPHLHIHTLKEDKPETGAARPLLFNTGWAIEKGSFGSPQNGANWFQLTSHGLPGKGSTRAFIWPSEAKPRYNDRIYTGAWTYGSDNHAMQEGLMQIVFPSIDNAYQAQGLRLEDMSVINDKGNILYSGVWRQGSGASKIQYGLNYSAFKSEYDSLVSKNYRLLDVEVFKNANNDLKFAGVYREGYYKQKFVAGMSITDLLSNNTSFSGLGYHLGDVEVYKGVNGTNLYAAVWSLVGSGDNPIITAASWSSFTTQWSDKVKLGYQLADLDTEEQNGSTFYVGVFIKVNGSNYLWESNWNSFNAKWEDLSKKNLRLADLNIRLKPGVANLVSNPDTGVESTSNESLELRDKIADKQEVTIYPNPVVDLFTLKTASRIISWNLYNGFGQIVRNEKLNESSTERQIQTEGLKSGHYFLSVQTENGLITKQLEIIQQ